MGPRFSGVLNSCHHWVFGYGAMTLTSGLVFTGWGVISWRDKYQFALPYYYYDDYNDFNYNNSNYPSDGCKGKDSNNYHDECKDNNNDDHNHDNDD